VHHNPPSGPGHTRGVGFAANVYHVGLALSVKVGKGRV